MQILRLWIGLYGRAKVIFIAIGWMASFTMGMSRAENRHPSQKKKEIICKFIFVFGIMGKAFMIDSTLNLKVIRKVNCHINFIRGGNTLNCVIWSLVDTHNLCDITVQHLSQGSTTLDSNDKSATFFMICMWSIALQFCRTLNQILNSYVCPSITKSQSNV